MNITSISHDIDSDGTTVTITLDDFTAPADESVEVIFSDEVWEALQRFAPKESKPLTVVGDVTVSGHLTPSITKDGTPWNSESWFFMKRATADELKKERAREDKERAQKIIDSLAPGEGGLKWTSGLTRGVERALVELGTLQRLVDNLHLSVVPAPDAVWPMDVLKESIDAAIYLATESLRKEKPNGR